MLRDIAEGIAEFIREDQVLHDAGHVTVVVEDKADISTEITTAIGSMGVCVVIAVTGSKRVPQSPILQGDINFEISCHESPEFNRDDDSALTAQGVMERLLKILHTRQFPFLYKHMLFNDFTRDDVDEANIVSGNFTAHHILGYEDRFFGREENETPQN